MILARQIAAMARLAPSVRYDSDYSWGYSMPRVIKSEPKMLTLSGQKAVNFTVRLPLDLALRIEDYLHEEMKRNLIQSGSRAEASIANMFREAIVHFLECPNSKQLHDSGKLVRPKKTKE